MGTNEKGGKTATEKPKKDYTAAAALGTLGIIVASIAMIAVTDLLFPFWRGPISDMLMFLAMNAVSMLMLALSVFLTFIYLKDYLELRSGFTFGILMAVVSFMLFAITSTPLLYWFMGIYGRTGMFSVVPYVFATISLAILAWLSSK